MNHPAVDNCLRLATEKQALEEQVKELKKKVRHLQKENRRLKALHMVAETLRDIRLNSPILCVKGGSGVICESHPADGC